MNIKSARSFVIFYQGAMIILPAFLLPCELKGFYVSHRFMLIFISVMIKPPKTVLRKRKNRIYQA